ncbi:MAG TPA: class I SAM-dependent methyltransferase [Acetobacteraceae bacterium]|nr:class I SAM-dependent methyltransferase [Acetobacteraceae bacterium]
MSAPGGQFAEGVLVQAMWQYAALVLRPTQAARRSGFVPRSTQGNAPVPVERPGLGKRFSVTLDTPLMLGAATEHDHLVEEFDRMGEIYEAYVRPFSTPIMDEALAELSRYIRPDWRLLDAGCGAGREACRLARLVPHGEVVGIDLAAGMVAASFRSARAKGLDNTAFIQADVGALPDMLTGAFDLAYSLLAHHHYPEPEAAARAIFRCLRPGGLYAVIDAGPEWFAKLSAPLAAWADPGWIGFHTPDQFRALDAFVGFVDCCWISLLPGFGIALARKPDVA